MSKRKKKTNAPENSLELLENLKEETEVKEKVNIFKKIGGGIKGFFTSKAGKITTVAVVATTAAGAIIYKVFFADGHEELIKSDTELDLNEVSDNETDEAEESEDAAPEDE